MSISEQRKSSRVVPDPAELVYDVSTVPRSAYRNFSAVHIAVPPWSAVGAALC